MESLANEKIALIKLSLMDIQEGKHLHLYVLASATSSAQREVKDVKSLTTKFHILILLIANQWVSTSNPWLPRNESLASKNQILAGSPEIHKN